MRNFAYTVLIVICAAILPGCFGGGGGGSFNPVGPTAPEVITAPIPETTVDANVATGTATVVIRIVLSERSYERQALTNIRASAQAPYVQAQLFVDDKLLYSKTAAVVNGAIEIAFTGVVNSGLARVELNFVGCHLHGATKFSGSSQISQQTVISVKPIWPEGAIVTSDGRLLREIGTAYARYGKVTSAMNITFNAAGNPVGYDRDGYARDFVSGQTYFTFNDLTISGEFAPGYICQHNGGWLAGAGNVIRKVNPDMKSTSPWLGSYSQPGWCVDGASLTDARFEVVNNIQSVNGTVYIYNSYQQIVEVGVDKVKVYSCDRIATSMSITENGGKYMGVGLGGKDMALVEMLGGTNYKMASPIYTDKGAVTSAISYEGGMLVALDSYVSYVTGGAEQSQWLTISYQYGLPGLKVLKSPNGKIYVHAYQMGKIWEVL